MSVPDFWTITSIIPSFWISKMPGKGNGEADHCEAQHYVSHGPQHLKSSTWGDFCDSWDDFCWELWVVQIPCSERQQENLVTKKLRKQALAVNCKVARLVCGWNILQKINLCGVSKTSKYHSHNIRKYRCKFLKCISRPNQRILSQAKCIDKQLIDLSSIARICPSLASCRKLRVGSNFMHDLSHEKKPSYFL